MGDGDKADGLIIVTNKFGNAQPKISFYPSLIDFKSLSKFTINIQNYTA